MPRPALTRTGLLAAITLVLMLLGIAPAGAHGVLEEEGPVLIGNLHSSITERSLPAGVSVHLLENGYVLRVTNHSSQDYTASAAEEDADHDTADHDAAGATHDDADHEADHDAEPLPVAAGATELWVGAPSAVTDEDQDAADKVGSGESVREWAVTLTGADGGTFTVRGAIDRQAAPSPAWWVLGVLALLVVVALTLLARPTPGSGARIRLPVCGLLACGVLGLAIETAATMLARTAGEGSLDMLREYLPQIGACLLGLVACVLVWRRHRLATVLAVTAAFVLGAGVVGRWPLLWSSVAVSRLPIELDRLLVLLVSASALAAAVLVVVEEVRSSSTAEAAPVS